MEKGKIPAALSSLAKRVEEQNSSRVFFLILKEPLTRKLVDFIYLNRDKMFDEKGSRLDIIIDSLGGDIDAAYKLVQLIRARYSKIGVYVPRFAKSAATFLCITADEIIMCRTAELGPLDAQVQDPRDPDSFISALDSFKTLDAIREYAIQTLDMSVHLILQRRRKNPLPIYQTIELASDFVGKILAPLFAQIDPLILGRHRRVLDIAKQYTIRVLSEYGLYNGDVERFAERLIYNYPSHSFVIDYHEAVELKLPVRLPNREEEQVLDAAMSYIERGQFVLSPRIKQSKSTKPTKEDTGDE